MAPRDFREAVKPRIGATRNNQSKGVLRAEDFLHIPQPALRP